MANQKQQISIWFFIGGLLAVYGVLILAASLYDYNSADSKVVLSELHVGVWWGALLVILGAVYSFMFAPWRRSK
jgi:uncharacterized membrane protein